MASSSYFKSDDKSNYHAWKMSLDLTLEKHDAMYYVQGKITKPPSNALPATKKKFKKGEVKAKKIITDSIHKHLVAYISDLGTSKEMYDKLVSMFKARNANQVLFLKNKLKDIKKGRGEDIQSYFMRIIEIKIDLLLIREVIANRELTLIALGGLLHEWDVFNTNILKNDTRIIERDMPSNRNDSNAFSAHAKRKNNAGSKRQC